jgi:hypothetical protein
MRCIFRGRKIVSYSDCQMSDPFQNNCAHRKTLRARINLVPTLVVTVTQSDHNYANTYSAHPRIVDGTVVCPIHV